MNFLKLHQDFLIIPENSQDKYMKVALNESSLNSK
jgi:hypothetical protein